MASILSNDSNFRKRINGSLLLRIVRYARPYKVLIGVMMATIVLSGILAALQPLLLRLIIDQVLPERDLGQLGWLITAMVTLAISSGLIGMLQGYLNMRIGEGITYDLRCSLYQHLQRLSLRFFTGRRTGELMSRFNNDVLGARRALTSTLFDSLSRVISIVVTLSAMFALNWRLTLAVLAAFAVASLLLIPAGMVARRMRQLARTQYILSAEMNVMMNETLNVGGALFLRIFDLRGLAEQRFFNLARRIRDNAVRVGMIGRWFFFGIGILSSLGTALTIGAGAYLVLTLPDFTLGTLLAFVTYLGQLYGPMRGFLGMQIELSAALVSFERVFELLDIPIEIEDRPGASTLRDVAGRVTFENVSFSYSAGAAAALLARLETQTQAQSVAANIQLTDSGDDLNELEALAANTVIASINAPPQELREEITAQAGRAYALEDISFAVEPGRVVALVGPSGAGKTTLTYLLPRLYDPTAGRITIDDRDIRDVTIASLSSQIGMVTQETYIFHETIRANLLYARSAATEDELHTACKAAHIHDMIMALPKQYDSVVGERGYRISGGEKQRIAIARLLLKDPRILILDEATSSLDSQSERLIQAALERLMVGRTTFIIAHRLSTVLSADIILVLDKGRLVERGRHGELLAQAGLYADLYRTQFDHTLDAEVANAVVR